MNGHIKLFLALMLVFVLVFISVFVEVIYVLWYRRRFQRDCSVVDDPELSAAVPAGDTHGRPSSKQFLLYFLCWNNQSRVEPAVSTAVTPVFSFAAASSGFTPGPAASEAKPPPPPPPSSASVEAELAKLRGMYASRVLFTIREEEEEEEGAESDGRRSPRSGRLEIGRFHFVGGGEEKAVEDDEDTPFSTPCASPPFYTPPSSPPRAVEVSVNLKISLGSEDSDDGVISPAEVK